jgi:hypothetical protein
MFGDEWPAVRNVETPFDAAIAQTFALGGFTLVAIVVVLTVAVFRHGRALPPPFRLAVLQASQLPTRDHQRFLSESQRRRFHDRCGQYQGRSEWHSRVSFGSSTSVIIGSAPTPRSVVAQDV